MTDTLIQADTEERRVCSKHYISPRKVSLKEHYHVFAHALEFDFRTGGQEFKDVGIDIELSQIRLHRPQSTLALP